MSGAQWGLVGGIAGGLLGTAGGVIGTYFSIRNTRTVEERSFMVRFSAAIWLMGLALITVLVLGLAKVILGCLDRDHGRAGPGDRPGQPAPGPAARRGDAP